MLLIDKMKNSTFSKTERIIIDYILAKEEDIKGLSTRDIAKETYTSSSLLVRISKKLGYPGWNAFKEDYLNELAYLKKHFTNIDANKPFLKNDNLMTIVNKMTQLNLESTLDTLSLIHHDPLQKAVQILEKSKRIKIFCLNNLNFAAQEFKYKMYRINKPVIVNYTEGEMFFEAAMSNNTDCAILISYSGNSDSIIETARILKKRNIPTVAITNIGENKLSLLTDVVLNITTREKAYSKIAGFSSLTSINLVLNILFSCFFALNYDANFDYRVKISQEVEYDRKYDHDIITE